MKYLQRQVVKTELRIFLAAFGAVSEILEYLENLENMSLSIKCSVVKTILQRNI